MPALMAFCDACEASVPVGSEDVLEFDVRCAACRDGTLVLRWTATEPALPRLAPPPPPPPPPPAPITTRSARPSGALPGATVPPPAPPRRVTGVVALLPPEPDPIRADETRADDEETEADEDQALDPFEEAAAKLDASVTVAMKRARRHAAAALGQPSPSEIGRQLAAEEGDAERGDRPTTVMRIQGTPPEAPPLPSLDGGDTNKLTLLAHQVPADPVNQPVSLEAPREAALPGLEVVQVAGAGSTRGPGSRTYDRSGAEAPPAASGQVARPSTPQGPVPRIEDSDWLALIDGLTEEEASEGPSRVFIRLPGDAAPTDVASQEQVAKFNATMKELEEGGGSRLAKLIAEGEAPRGATDPQTRPWDDTGKGPPRGAEDPKTQPWEDTGKAPRGAEDPETRPWDDPARRNEATATTPQPAGLAASARSESSESSGRIVKEFDTLEFDPALVCAREATSPKADAFRQLYQRIFHAERPAGRGAGGSDGLRRPPRVVLVTSPGPGAGKTTVAANLAVVGARIPGRGAVLVDADPRSRRGGVLRYFGVKRRAEGLLEALGSDGKLEGRTLQFSLGTLDVLPLGLPGSNAPEMIASDRLMGDMLERLRTSYPNSVVVIDGSAALQAADPLVLARLADGVVLVIRAGQTAREDVRRAIDLLGPERVLGVVLNDARD